MPNHVKQRLTVHGRREDVAAFIATARGASPNPGLDPKSFCRNDPDAGHLHVKPLCFHMIAPLDDDYSRKPYGTGDSYGWHAEADNWSVKWGPYDFDDAEMPEVEAEGTQARYDFACAWGPPVKALQRASLRYRCLTFILSWGGEGPCRGRHVFAGGTILHEQNDDYTKVIKLDIDAYHKANKYDGSDDWEDKHYDALSKITEGKYIDSHAEFVAEQLAEVARGD